MKKLTTKFCLQVIALCFCIPASLNAQKNYISIEGGRYFSGVKKDLNSQMISSGFGDKVFFNLDDFYGLLDILFPFWSFSSSGIYSEQYPQSSAGKDRFWFRYGRELKNGKSVELSYGKLPITHTEGFDVTGSGENPDGNRLKYSAEISEFTAHYIFSDKKKSLGIGAGLAIAFDKITIEANSSIDTKKLIQPGLSGTAYWRFINGKLFFMSLRTDAIIFAPAAIDEIVLTSPKNVQSTFHGTKINKFNGDITVSVGIKF